MAERDRETTVQEQDFDWGQFFLGAETRPDKDWPVDHVPQTARRGLVSVSAVLLGFVFFADTLYAGAAPTAEVA